MVSKQRLAASHCATAREKEAEQRTTPMAMRVRSTSIASSRPTSEGRAGEDACNAVPEDMDLAGDQIEHFLQARDVGTLTRRRGG
jgi:hypothetical protein